jgi:RNA polymerase sigma factor for flagellar operon FliA
MSIECRMPVVPFKVLFSRKVTPAPEGTPDYARLIVDHLPFIEKQCRRAADSSSGFRSNTDVDNETDLLLTEVIDHLKADNFKVLRDFRGAAKLTTYLTSVISHFVVDHIRSRKGRSRAAERARELGPLAEQLHKLVCGLGYTLADAHGHLLLSHGIDTSEDHLREMLQKIQGKDAVTSAVTATWPYQGREVLVDGDSEIIVPDPAKGADELLIDNQQEQKRTEALSILMDGLSGEERFILRLRFPTSESDTAHSIREIALLTGHTEKATDNRLRRILLTCREKLLRRGLSLDDLICVGD